MLSWDLVIIQFWCRFGPSDDEATFEFMKAFYQHLAKRQNTSFSLHLAMQCLQDSGQFSAVRYWAPFVLIGDDVTLEFDLKE